jgi:hypothetical protein
MSDSWMVDDPFTTTISYIASDVRPMRFASAWSFSGAKQTLLRATASPM